MDWLKVVQQKLTAWELKKKVSLPHSLQALE
jgi:hypothetical protein